MSRGFQSKQGYPAKSGGEFQQKFAGGKSGNPVLTSVSPASVEAFIQASVEHALTHCPEAVSSMKGKIGMVMAEFEVPHAQRFVIANMAGTVAENGMVRKAHQTLVEYRAELLIDVRVSLGATVSSSTVSSSDTSNSKSGDTSLTEGKTVKDLELVLWPKSGEKSRDHRRSTQISQVNTMLQKMLYLFPSESVRSLMSNDRDLNVAMERECMIGFICALRKFGVSGTGNVELNCEEAQEKLNALTMSKELGFTDYVSKFKLASKDLELLGSRWSVSKIVGIFIRNLDQTKEGFNDVYVRYLDKTYPEMYKLQQGSLQNAIDVMTAHYNDVVRVAHSYKKSAGVESRDKHKTISSFKQLSRFVEGVSGDSADSVQVSKVVLATLLKRKNGEGDNNNNNNNNNNPKDNNNKKLKITTDGDKKKQLMITDGSGKDLADIRAIQKSKSCYNFAKEGKCERGDTCWYKH